MNCLSTPVKVEVITTGETYGADVALMNQVKWKGRVKLQGTNKDGKCTIVLCPISSRVGSDVQAAMERVKVAKRVLLVLMHHTRDFDYSTAGSPWSEEYPNIDLEVHVLFHESVPGLLTCAKNTEAVYKMQKYLEQHGENTWLSRWWAMITVGLIVLFVVLLLVLLN